MGNYFLFGALITWSPFKVPHPKEFFYRLQFSSHLFSLSLSYLFLPHLYSNFAINSLGNYQLNSFSSSSCSYRLSFSASSPYSFSNSSTNSFAFSKFPLLSHVSPSAIYPFHHTKNFSFPRTTRLFKIFSTSNSSSPLMITSFRGVFFCPSVCSL